MRPLLAVEHLTKHFAVKKGLFRHTVGFVHAVDNVSFTINEGETLGLVGESGCGKTSVGKLILRLHNPDSGTIRFANQDITHMSRKELLPLRKSIQIIFQDPYGSLNPRMDVMTILSEPMIKHRLAKGEQIAARVIELLDFVGLNAHDRFKYPHEFSGGQRQRIVIARALASNPRLIVCDEPVSALDVSVQAQILNLMKEIQQRLGVSYLFIAHGMAVVKHISKRVGVMYMGNIVELAPAHIIFETACHPYTKALMSAVPIPDPDQKAQRTILQGEVPNPIDPPKGCRFSPRCPMAWEVCRTDVPELLEISPEHFVACHVVG